MPLFWRVVLYVRQDSPFSHVLKRPPAHQSSSSPSRRLSINTAWSRAGLTGILSRVLSKKQMQSLGAIRLESEDKYHPPFTALVQTSSRVASRSVLVITDTEELGISVEEMMEERETPAGPSRRRPELFQQAVSSEASANGFKIEAQVKMHDPERRSYVVRIEVQGP